MMKLRKPILSPGRTSTNPPPLMKFLRNKSSSTRRRSSSTTRARTPMFFRKKHTQISHIQQEPSSPKVTCIGQIKHSNKKNQTPNPNRNPNPNPFCQCLRTLKPSFLCKVLTKWVSFFRCGYCETEKSRENKNSSPKKVDEAGPFSKGPGSSNVQLFSANVNKNEGGVLKSPPKNAFLLTRCRSAPYRSTSLASKLCETSVDEEEIKSLEVKKDGYEDEDVNEGVISGDEELMVIKGIEGIKEREMPLFLTRCKSESGRKWDKFLV